MPDRNPTLMLDSKTSKPSEKKCEDFQSNISA